MLWSKRIVELIGCPNCTTDLIFESLHREYFDKYVSLNFVRKFGKSTKLFQCNECKIYYYNSDDCDDRYALIIPRNQKKFFDFFSDENIISENHLIQLNLIGSPDKNFQKYDEFPAQVKTKDGKLWENAVIRLSNDLSDLYSIWSHHLVSEIDQIIPSPNAMTLEQRVAAYNRPNRVAIWLKRNGYFYSLGSSYFLLTRDGNPKDYFLASSDGPSIGEYGGHLRDVDVTYFVGPFPSIRPY